MKITFRTSAFALCLTLVLSLFCGCNDKKQQEVIEPSTATVTEQTTEKATIKSSMEKITLPTGGTAFFSFTVEPAEMTNSVAFTSDNENVAEVDSAGRIDAVAVGSANITAQIGSEKIVCAVTVVPSENNDNTGFSTAFEANEVILAENLKSGSGKLPYYIKVNRLKNCVTVYTYDKNGDYTVPVRAMICSTGENQSTVMGEFEIGVKYRWLYLYGDVYGQYISGFYGDFLFHSVPYEQKSADTLKADEYNKLGQSVSMGCVRLAVADTKWIYENCDAGTKVLVFDSEEDGPLGTPSSMHINADSTWDPTDDNKDNPYRNSLPVISGANDVTVKKGESFDKLQNVSAVDSCKNDITEKIEVTGEVITDKAGVYRLTYRVTDDMKRTATKDIYVTVS